MKKAELRAVELIESGQAFDLEKPDTDACSLQQKRFTII